MLPLSGEESPRPGIERAFDYGARVPDAPNPHGRHEHLFHPHQLDAARAAAREGRDARAVVACVICGATTAITAPAPEREQVAAEVEAARRRVEETPATLARITQVEAERCAPAGRQREEVVGLVQAAWPTFDVRYWRVVVGERVLFAHADRGHLEVLREAHVAGEQVVVVALWASGDCYVQSVARV